MACTLLNVGGEMCGVNTDRPSHTETFLWHSCDSC